MVVKANHQTFPRDRIFYVAGENKWIRVSLATDSYFLQRRRLTVLFFSLVFRPVDEELIDVVLDWVGM